MTDRYRFEPDWDVDPDYRDPDEQNWDDEDWYDEHMWDEDKRIAVADMWPSLKILNSSDSCSQEYRDAARLIAYHLKGVDPLTTYKYQFVRWFFANPEKAEKLMLKVMCSFKLPSLSRTLYLESRI